MSRVYFHSEFGDAELHGSERAHCGVTCSGLALALLHLPRFGNDDPIYQLTSPPTRDVNSLNTLFSIGQLKFVLPDGRCADSFLVALNTILVAGNDVLRLMARLHGQCEIHGYVEGHNRRWLAGLISEGVDSRLLRSGRGWGAVIELLRSDRTKPVVTSYSVCDGFPNQTIAGCVNDEEWDALPPEKQWRRAMSGLRQAACGLEWKPDEWATARLGNGITAMDLRAIADKLPSAPIGGPSCSDRP